MKKVDNNAIVNGPIGKQLVLFFVPVWLGLMFQQLYNTVDTLVVGQFVGTNAVAAVGNVAFVVQLIIGMCAGIANGAGVIISQHYGAEKYDQVKVDIRCSLVIALIGGVIFSVLGVAMSETSVRWLNTPEEIVADSTTYLQVYFCAMIPALIYNFGTAILRGMGDSRRPLYVLIVASVVNIVLDLLFVIVFKWGVFGVALATDIAQIVSAVMVIILLVKAQPGVLRGSIKHMTVYRNIFHLGIPAAIQSMMYSFSNLMIQVAVNGFGTAIIAAWTIYGKVDCINWMTTGAMGMAVTSFAGQNFGAGRYDRVKRCAKLGNLYLGIAVFAIIVVLYVGAYPLFEFFSKDAEVVQLGVDMMRFLIPAYMLYFPVEVYTGALRGCGDVKVPTIVSIIGTCLVRVLWIQFVVPLWNTMENVMLCYVVTWALVSGFFIVYFARGKWLGRCIAGRG